MPFIALYSSMGHQVDTILEAVQVDSKSSSSSSSDTSSSDGRAVTPPTPEHVPLVERKFFNRKQTIEYLSNMWSRRLEDSNFKFISHVNCSSLHNADRTISSLHNADRTIWGTSEGREVRRVVRKLKAIFVAKLCADETCVDVKSARDEFAVGMQCWFDDMVLFAKKQPADKRSKKSTSLEVLHQVRCFWSLQAVRDLGDHPTMGRLFDLRGTLWSCGL